MTDIPEKELEAWSELQKRTLAAESNVSHGFLPGIKATAVIIIIIGALLMMIKFFGFRNMMLYNLGGFLFVIGVIIFGIIYWLNTGAGTIKKEREKMIQERGMRHRCMYLQGDLPDGLAPRSGRCELYQKDITNYPYCIYCKYHITEKEVEIKKKKKEH